MLLLSDCQMLVVEAAHIFFPAAYALDSIEGRERRWARAYEYMLPEFRASRNCTDIVLSPGTVVVEAGTGLVICYYNVSAALSQHHAEVRKMIDLIASLPRRFRHPIGPQESTFYMSSTAVTAGGVAKFPNSYTLFPNTHAYAPPASRSVVADAHGTLHQCAMHYAMRRVRQGGFDRPAWMRVVPNSTTHHSQAEKLAAAVDKYLSKLSNVFWSIVPDAAVCQQRALSNMGSVGLAAAQGAFTEAFFAVDPAMALHDGCRDDQLGFAVSGCALAQATSVAPADARSLLFLPWGLRTPAIDGAFWIWRPSMYPHGSVAPAISEVSADGRDMVFTLQVGRATYDRLVSKEVLDEAELVRLERSVRLQRFENENPVSAWQDTDEHIASVWKAVKQR